MYGIYSKNKDFGFSKFEKHYTNSNVSFLAFGLVLLGGCYFKNKGN